MIGPSKKLLLIGWDAADWRLINPLLDEGKLPNLRRLVEGGTIGNIATIEPMLSPMLWTSIATGKRAHKHGVLGFSEIDPISAAVRPVTTLSRKTRAIWNILTLKEKRCNVIGWWPSHPAEPINGVMVSNEFQSAPPELDETWPLPRDSVYPERLRGPIADLRLHPRELSHEHIGPFVPRWQEIDRAQDQRIDVIGKILAECSSVHAVATAVMQLEPWEFMGIYYNAIDAFCHHFMPFHPPHCPGVPEKDFELYRNVVTAAYRYHDLMLGTLMELAGEETAILLVSDHGFHSDDARKRVLPEEPAAIANDHRRFGIFAMRGSGIKKDERIYGASILDVAPTILHYFGLPFGRDMDGKPLLGLFERPSKAESIPSWDLIPGADGSHPPGKRINSIFAAKSLKQLAALGYIAEPEVNAAALVDKTNIELEYNLARALMDGREYTHAAEILATLYERNPQQHRFGIQLAYSYKALNQANALKTLVDLMINRRFEEARQAEEELSAVVANEGHSPDLLALDPQRRRQIAALRRKASTNFCTLEFLLGYAEMALGNIDSALGHFDRARGMDSGRVELYLQLGQAYLRLRRWPVADECFRSVLNLDPDSAPAHTGLCRCFLGQHEYYKAVNCALSSVGLIYFNPYAHFLLGIALQGFGSYSDAEKAFRVAIAQEPGFLAAHRGLGRLYERHLGESAKSQEHKTISRRLLGHQPQEKERTMPLSREHSLPKPAGIVPSNKVEFQTVTSGGIVTIVSGLPRSGTSLMMQLLDKGGLPVLVDDRRPADENNPHGFFEFEKVKELHRDASWFAGAMGKCVKIVAPLLEFVPDGFHCRVVLMKRPLREIAASQSKMLARKNGDLIANEGETLANLACQWNNALSHLKNRRIPFLEINYLDCLNSFPTVCSELEAFLQVRLNRERMEGVVDQNLYRSRETYRPEAPESSVYP
ncbi:MAG: type phosphodiesterase/nucleotide pyrophosphatase [Verrucomicrobiales bacterium]|nr:type phosphodiesterase/nucleotide pyrophosphatase [Verrucomicrobiales bacterium]